MPYMLSCTDFTPESEESALLHGSVMQITFKNYSCIYKIMHIVEHDLSLSVEVEG